MKKMPIRPAEVMTVEQVADYLQLNKLTVYKYVRNGRLPASRIGKSYRIRKADVETFLDNARQGARRSGPAVARGPAGREARSVGGAPAMKAEDVYVGPSRRREEPDAHESPSIYPMEWVIRGLH